MTVDGMKKAGVERVGEKERERRTGRHDTPQRKEEKAFALSLAREDDAKEGMRQRIAGCRTAAATDGSHSGRGRRAAGRRTGHVGADGVGGGCAGRGAAVGRVGGIRLGLSRVLLIGVLGPCERNGTEGGGGPRAENHKEDPGQEERRRTATTRAEKKGRGKRLPSPEIERKQQ